MPWLAVGVVLILAGVAAAPGPAGEEVGIIDRTGEPQRVWEVNLGIEADAAGVFTTSIHPHIWLAEEAVIHVEQDRIQSLSTETGATLWAMDGVNLSCHLDDPAILCASGRRANAELIQLHTTDGELDRTASPGLLAALPVGDGLITVRAEASGTVAARERHDGAQVWSSLIGAANPQAGDQHVATMIDLVADKVRISIYAETGSTSALLESRTGIEHGPQDLIAVRDPRLMGERWLAMRPEGIIHVIGADGELGPALAPEEHVLHVDDDAASEVYFTTDESDLVAVARESGRELWRTNRLGTAVALARMGEMLLAHQGVQLIGLDLATGDQRWGQAAPLTSHAFGDGEVLVHIGAGSSTAAVGSEGLPAIEILGIETGTGDTVFELSFPGSRVHGHALTDDGLALLTDAGLSLWTW